MIVSLYKRGKIWHYEFMVAGQRFRSSTKHVTRAKAEKFQAGKMAEAQNGLLSTHNRIPTLLEMKPRFFDWVEASQLRSPSKRYYREGWKVLKETKLPHLKLNRISSDEVDAAHLSGSPAFVNQAIRTLRRMLGKAQEWKLIPSAPRLHLRTEQSRETIITDEQETKLLIHMQPAFRVAYLMMKDGGMRRDEVARAKVENIDWSKATYFVEDGKTAKARRLLFLSKRLFDALFVHTKERRKGWLFVAKKAESGHVSPDTLSHRFRQARNAAKLPSDIVLYSARHTFGTVVYQRTGNLKLVMELMGHASVKTAMIYQHPELELGREAIDAHNAERVN
jgi:integrase/recombinase XerC